MRIMLYVFLFVLLSSCGDSVVENKSFSNDVKISYLPALIQSSERLSLDNKNDLSYVLINKNDIVFYKKGKQKALLENTYAKKAWLSVSGKYVYIFWWVKYNNHEEDRGTAGKSLYVRASQDGGKTFSETSRINSMHGVLPDVKIVANSKGNVAIAYLDERGVGYQIYTNSSSDGGVTWLKKDVAIGDLPDDADTPKKVNNITPSFAVSPHLNSVGDKLVVTWEQNNLFNKKMAVRLVSRVSNDFGKTWGDVEEIYRDYQKSSIELKAAATDDKLVLLAVLNKGLVAFVKNLSDSWVQVKGIAPNTNKAKIVSYIKTATDNKKLYVSYVYVGEGVRREGWNTELSRLNLQSLQWENKSYRFNEIAGEVKLPNRSGYQDVAVLSNGTIFVVWEDFRGILPAIFINYSTDGGATWLEKPYSLTKLGVESAEKPMLKASDNQLNVLFNVFTLKDETRPLVRTRRVILPSPEGDNFLKLGLYQYKHKDKASQEEKLKKRMEELVKLRLSHEFEKEWDLLDPIYRNTRKKLSWMANRSLLRFTKQSVDSVEVERNIGHVKGKAVVEFTDQLEAGAELNKQKKKNGKDYDMKWGWFNNNWYMVPEDPLMPHLP